jgi:hypothetical protein
MAAELCDLLIEQGATYSEVLTVYSSPGVGTNLSNYTAVMQIRQRLEDDLVLASSSTIPATISLSLGTSGEITIGITSTVTSYLNFDVALYDIKLTNIITGEVTRVFEGEVKLSKAISRLLETAPPSEPTATFQHNDLAGLQGGSTAERYHITGSQQVAISSIGNGEVNFTPKPVAIGTAEGTLFYCSTDNYLYLGVE